MNEILSFSAKKIKPCPCTLIIAPTQTILRIIRTELKEIGQDLKQLQLIADSIPLYTCEKFSVLGPIVGQNAINLALEPLLVEKIKVVFLLSVAGANNPNYSIGEIRQGETFTNENGLTYQASTKLADIKTSSIYTVNSAYRDHSNSNHCDLIEMEAAEVVRLCIQYKVDFKTLFCVSDLCNKDEKWQQGFSTKEFSLALKNAAKLILR